MLAMDFGAGSKLAVHGPDGPVSLPYVSKMNGYQRGMNSAEQFAVKLAYLLDLDDVATEAATIGASGAEVQLIENVVKSASHRLYTLSGRVVKNYRKDHGQPDKVPDAEAARILYETATKKPSSLHLWTGVSPRRSFQYRSVRPYDKRDYKDPFVEEMLSHLPDPSVLDPELAAILCKNGQYSGAAALPLAMSLSEDGASNAKTWTDKILGMHSHGKPSFYRRKTSSDLVQALAKLQTGKRRNAEITPEERKVAQKALRRYLRQFHHLWQNQLQC